MSINSRCNYESEEGISCQRPIWSAVDKENRFCLFHSHLVDEKREEFNREIELLISGGPTELFLFDNLYNEDIISFVGFVFPNQHLNLSELSTDLSLDFSESSVNGYIILDNAKITGGLIFNNTLLQGIKGSRVTVGSFYFSCDNSMETSIALNESEIKGDFDVESGNILELELTNCNVHGNVVIHDCQIESLSLANSILNGYISLYKVDSERTDFSCCSVRKGLSMQRCLVNTLDIEYLESDHSIEFENSTFGTISAQEMSYNNLLIFRYISFDYPLESLMKKVFGRATFKYKDIRMKLDLRNVYLSKAQFVETDLTGATFGAAYLKEIVFDRVTFAHPKGGWWSINSALLGRPRTAIYEEIAARELRRRKSERRHEYRKRKRKSFEAAETVYRSIKHTMMEQHSGNLARRMRAGELEMRMRGAGTWWERILIAIYRFINGYGISWIRAAILWVMCVYLFAMNVYAGEIGTYEKKTGETTMTTNEMIIYPLDAILHSLELTSVETVDQCPMTSRI